jgi:acyl dehydratase
MKIYESVDAMKAAVGVHHGYSDWREITQDQINLFADATGDHQWIHVDEQAAANGPFGTTIAHGFMTLALVPVLTGGLTPLVAGVTMVINYGCNRVRFPSPLPVNSRVRAGLVLKSVEEVSGGIQIVNDITIEREGGDKPACVVESVSRLYL